LGSWRVSSLVKCQMHLATGHVFLFKRQYSRQLILKNIYLCFALSTCYVNDALHGKAMPSNSYYMYIQEELDVGKKKLVLKVTNV